MGWRKRLFQAAGPGLTVGITLGDWARMLADNRFLVPPRYWPRALFSTLVSLVSTPLRRAEDLAFGSRFGQERVEAPLFIIGHWRSGTTHLHNLIAVDRRFAFANFSQILIPHTFLIAEKLMAAGMALLLPRDRLVDSMAMHANVPWEEEFALCVATSLSPYMTWAFPDRASHYDRYLTFEDVPEVEIDRWKAAFVKLLKKLTLKYKRPLILKSPPNTARIKLLLEMFPDARFVHIHRDPYVVYQSTVRLNSTMWENNALQRPDPATIHNRVIRQYAQMFDAYFAEKSLIPRGRLCEVSYGELEANPIGVVGRIYRELALPDFAEVEPALCDYVRSLNGYEKNTHVALKDETRAEIDQAWRRSFEEWGYPLESEAPERRRVAA
jgi:hypothetical protein